MPANSIDLQLAPAQLLPPEILAEIFLHCVRNTPSESWLRVDRPPWIFGKVCCLWRAVCLSTPSLWGNLPRLYMNSAHYRDPRVLALLRTSLALSRTMPLSFDLTIFIEADTCIAKTIPLFYHILPEIQRCRDLVLASNGHSLPLLKNFSGKLESLQSLQLRFFGPTGDFGITQSINFFDKAPLLTNASIIIDSSRDNPANNPEHLPFAIRCIPLPWYQLTTFSTTYISDMFLLDVIRNAPLLKECSFTSTWHSSQAATPLNPVTHRRLEMLSLLFKTHNDAPNQVPIHLIEKLFLPSLKHLECKYLDNHIACLISLVERSRCTLLSLTTHAHAGDVNGEIISFLGCIPHIRELELHGIGGEALAAMTISPNASTSALVPKLQSLTVEFPRCTSRDIQDFIRSRTVDLELGSVQHLDVVILCFKSEQQYWELYHQLEGWSARTPGDDEAYNSLLYRKRVLGNWVQALRTGGKSQLLRVENELDDILRTFEEESPLQGLYLNTSKIYDLISSLREILLANSPPYDGSVFTVQNQLISRIETISNQWRSTLDDYLAYPRWTHGNQTEVYYEMVYFTGSNSASPLFSNDSAESRRRNYPPFRHRPRRMIYR